MSSEPSPEPSPVIQAAEIATIEHVALAPGFALAQAYVSTAQALSLQALHQQSAQQQAHITTQAVTTMVSAQLLSVDVAGQTTVKAS